MTHKPEPLLCCPTCNSQDVATANMELVMANTFDHYCYAMKIQDSNSYAVCLACEWRGERKDLKEAA
jgi:transcription elongation factor Elf1